MDHVSSFLLLFVSLTQWITAELVHGLLTRLTFWTSIHLILFPTILSGTVALLVKYLAAVRILPVCKLVSGGLLALLVSWYIDRICKDNAYLLVRSVGFAIVLAAALGFVIVSEEGFADRGPRLEAEAVTVDSFIARD
jgi:uncharacterized membrane protein